MITGLKQTFLIRASTLADTVSAFGFRFSADLRVPCLGWLVISFLVLEGLFVCFVAPPWCKAVFINRRFPDLHRGKFLPVRKTLLRKLSSIELLGKCNCKGKVLRVENKNKNHADYLQFLQFILLYCTYMFDVTWRYLPFIVFYMNLCFIMVK
jgi:hypothetical protein